MAAHQGALDLLKLLTEAGADVNTEDHGVSALRIAADKGHEKVVKFLLANGARVDAEERSGFTALLFAASRGHLNIFRLLIGHGANVHHVAAQKGVTALHLSAQSGRLDIVRALVAAGLDVNRPTLMGNTPLVFARSGKHRAVVAALVRAGAKDGAQAGPRLANALPAPQPPARRKSSPLPAIGALLLAGLAAAAAWLLEQTHGQQIGVRNHW